MKGGMKRKEWEVRYTQVERIRGTGVNERRDCSANVMFEWTFDMGVHTHDLRRKIN